MKIVIFYSKQELLQENKVLSVCNINKNVWCLDSEGTVHVYRYDRKTPYSLLSYLMALVGLNILFKGSLMMLKVPVSQKNLR